MACNSSTFKLYSVQLLLQSSRTVRRDGSATRALLIVNKLSFFCDLTSVLYTMHPAAKLSQNCAVQWTMHYSLESLQTQTICCITCYLVRIKAMVYTILGRGGMTGCSPHKQLILMTVILSCVSLKMTTADYDFQIAIDAYILF